MKRKSGFYWVNYSGEGSSGLYHDIANGRDREIRVGIAIASDEAKENSRKERINAPLTIEEKIFKRQRNERAS